MKRFLLLALCAIFALDAGARTLYVDAKRPNNKGNGRSVKKAKKTIQAAINVAKKGDTILVLPGTYAPIKTNNKKIAIKSVKGQNKTKLAPGKNDSVAADLAKHAKKNGGTYGFAYADAIGNATVLSGFLLEHVGYHTLFPYAAVFVALSFVTMLCVKHGDSKPVQKKRGLEAYDELDA